MALFEPCAHNLTSLTLCTRNLNLPLQRGLLLYGLGSKFIYTSFAQHPFIIIAEFIDWRSDLQEFFIHNTPLSDALPILQGLLRTESLHLKRLHVDFIWGIRQFVEEGPKLPPLTSLTSIPSEENRLCESESPRLHF